MPTPAPTPRLRFAPVAEEDAAALLALYGDPAVMRLYLRRPCADVAACRAVVRAMQAAERTGTGYRWSLRERSTDAVVGSLGYHAWDRARRTALLSYELVPPARGRGYAREAVAAVLAFGFGAMGLAEVAAEAHAENAPSIRLLEQAGFLLDGERTHDWDGEAVRFLRYRLARASFTPPRKRSAQDGGPLV